MCYAVWYFNLISDFSFILHPSCRDEEGGFQDSCSLQRQRNLGLKSFTQAGMAGRRLLLSALYLQDLLFDCLAFSVQALTTLINTCRSWCKTHQRCSRSIFQLCYTLQVHPAIATGDKAVEGRVLYLVTSSRVL